MKDVSGKYSYIYNRLDNIVQEIGKLKAISTNNISNTTTKPTNEKAKAKEQDDIKLNADNANGYTKLAIEYINKFGSKEKLIGAKVTTLDIETKLGISNETKNKYFLIQNIKKELKNMLTISNSGVITGIKEKKKV